MLFRAGPGSGISKYFAGDTAGLIAGSELANALDKSMATLTPSPQFEEVKKVYQEIHTTPVDISNPTVKIQVRDVIPNSTRAFSKY